MDIKVWARSLLTVSALGLCSCSISDYGETNSCTGLITKSVDESANAKFLQDILQRIEVVRFLPTTPGKLDWRLMSEDQVLVADIEYGFRYSQPDSSWFIFDENNTETGALEIYTNACGNFSSLRIRMFDSQEMGQMIFPVL